MAQTPQRFYGTVLHSSFPGGNIAAEITVSGEAIDVVYESGRQQLPYAGIKITRGGANDKLIFLAHNSVPDWSVYTREKAILKALAAVGGVDTQTAISGMKRDRRKSNREWLILAALVVLIIIGAWKAKDPAINLATYFVPISWEDKAGEVVYLQVQSQTKIIDDEALTADFVKMLEPLLAAVKESGYEFKIHLAEDSDLNAFALPGGHVIVNSAVIVKAESAEEVFGVLAHELAHVTERHAVKQIFAVFGLYFAFDIIFGNVAGTLAALTQAAPYLLQQGFSRDHEREADTTGFNTLIKANINPRGMVDFFRRVDKEQKEVPLLAGLEKHLGFMSTHPGTEERVQVLEAKVKEFSSRRYRPVGEGFADFQTRLKQLIEK